MNDKEYDKLTEEEVRIKVAEFDGWQGPFRGGSTHLHGFAKGIVVPPDAAKDNATRHWMMQDHVPDYLHDLNACHEMEKVMSRRQRRMFVNELQALCNGDPFTSHSATAAQRCKAFVLTMTAET